MKIIEKIWVKKIFGDFNAPGKHCRIRLVMLPIFTTDVYNVLVDWVFCELARNQHIVHNVEIL